MDEPDTITLRSFRVAFDLERRLFKIDRWRLPVPHGVPLRSLAYGAATLVGVALASALPLAGAALTLLPAPLRLVVLPGASAYALTRLRLDGRPAHRAALALLRWAATPRRIAAFRRCPQSSPARFAAVPFLPDESSASYRPATIRGPARVLVRYPASATRRSRTLRLRQTSRRPLARGKEITLQAGQRAVFR